MRFRFRRKDKDRSRADDGLSPLHHVPDEFLSHGAAVPPQLQSPPTRASSYLVAQLPPAILQRVFEFVCPHATDESYETAEGSANESGCMLCDLRDLSHCVKVNRQWRRVAIEVLYHSVRIDPVHYCRLEALLAERRKKTSRFDRNGVPGDPAQARLRLLRRSVRDDPTRLGKLVLFLKIPYMLRESSHVELAQTIAVLPNLRYVDLPEGMFSDEPSYATLRLEVQARCPDIRKMTYVGGAERSLVALAGGRVWTNLEVLELTGLNVDPLTMRSVLGSLTRLRALKVAETQSLSDEVLAFSEGYPSLGALEELVLKDTPRVTAAGLMEYLGWHETQHALKVLTLKDTGVRPSTLQDILSVAPSLTTLALQAKVSEPFPQATTNQPQLSSRTLQTLRYEINSTSSAGPYAGVEAGYHGYLASSILAGGLPRLRRLYVLDETFPEQLQGLPPPNAAFAGGHIRSSSNSSSSPGSPMSARLSPSSPRSAKFLSPLPAPRRPVSKVPPTNRFSSNNPFAPRVVSPASPTNTLEVFTKSDELGKWSFARVDTLPRPSGGGAANRRPISSYGLAADVAGQGWDRGEARRSVMVGDGTGTFLAVPGQNTGGGSEDGRDGAGGMLHNGWRPHSSGGETSPSRDLWR